MKTALKLRASDWDQPIPVHIILAADHHTTQAYCTVTMNHPTPPEAIETSPVTANPAGDLGGTEFGSGSSDTNVPITVEHNAISAPSDVELDDSCEDQIRLYHSVTYLSNRYNLDHQEGFGHNDQILGDPSFSLFVKLPIELRLRVWEHFCPELHQPSRVFAVALSMQHTKKHPYAPAEYVMVSAYSLAKSTSRLRTVLKVHQESRKLALQIVPDTLPIMYGQDEKRKGDIRFNSCRDIVLLPEKILGDRRLPLKRIPTAYLDRVQNMAVNFRSIRFINVFSPTDSRFLEFRNLKRIYFETSSEEAPIQNLRWVTTKKCSEQIVENASFTMWPLRFCWSVRGLQASDMFTKDDRKLRDTAEKAGWETYPLLTFSGRFGWEQVEWIRQREDLSNEEFRKDVKMNLARLEDEIGREEAAGEFMDVAAFVT